MGIISSNYLTTSTLHHRHQRTSNSPERDYFALEVVAVVVVVD